MYLLFIACMSWAILSSVLVVDAIRIRNWHAVFGWLVATIFIVLFFIVEFRHVK